MRPFPSGQGRDTPARSTGMPSASQVRSQAWGAVRLGIMEDPLFFVFSRLWRRGGGGASQKI